MTSQVNDIAHGAVSLTFLVIYRAAAFLGQQGGCAPSRLPVLSHIPLSCNITAGMTPAGIEAKLGSAQQAHRRDAGASISTPVSYTHLTLPTMATV